MPLYDYKCHECGLEKEVQHSMSEIGKIIIQCEVCEQPMKKLLSAPTLIGFDDVGRSINKKDEKSTDKKETPKTSTGKKEVPKVTSTKKEAA